MSEIKVVTPKIELEPIEEQFEKCIQEEWDKIMKRVKTSLEITSIYYHIGIFPQELMNAWIEAGKKNIGGCSNV